MDEEMLGALAKVPTGDATEIPVDDAMNDADGELTPELRMFAKELGFEPAKALALKNFVHECMASAAAGEYSETD